MDTQGLLDEKNADLWNTLVLQHEIDIQRVRANNYSVYSKNKKSTIYVPIDSYDPASFTHELLHIFLRTKEVFINGGLTLSVRENPVLAKIFSNELLDHVGNCLEHMKMLPAFVELGYEPKDFITDYSTNKLTDKEISLLKKHFSINLLLKRLYSKDAIDLYIGKYFAAIACPNTTFNYSTNLAKLKDIDQGLFSLLERFSTAWMKYDYNDTDLITGGYNEMLYNFIGDLNEWTKGKTIK